MSLNLPKICKLCDDTGVVFTLKTQDKSRWPWSCPCNRGAVYRMKYQTYKFREGHVLWDEQFDKPEDAIEEIKNEEIKDDGAIW